MLRFWGTENKNIIIFFTFYFVDWYIFDIFASTFGKVP